MPIIGCDFHSRFQQIAMLDAQTGEIMRILASHPRRQGSAMNGPTDIVGPPLTPLPARKTNRVS